MAHFSFLLSFYPYLWHVRACPCLCARFYEQNEDVNTAVSSLIGKYKGRWPGLSQL